MENRSAGSWQCLAGAAERYLAGFRNCAVRPDATNLYSGKFDKRAFFLLRARMCRLSGIFLCIRTHSEFP